MATWVHQLPSASNSPIYAKISKNGKSFRRKPLKAATTYPTQNAAQNGHDNLKHRPPMRDAKTVQVG